MLAPTIGAPAALLGALLLVRFVDELITFLPAGLLSQVTDEFHLSYARGGLLLSMFSAGGLLGSALTVAADHVSRRALAAGGAAVVGLCLLSFGLSPWFVGLLAAVVLWGVASDALVGGAETALVDVAGDHLPAALGRQNLLAALGDLASPLLLAGAAVVRIGWRAIFVVAAAPVLGYAAWLGSQPIPAPAPDVEASVVGGVLDVLRDRRAWLLAAAEAMVSVIDEPYLAFVILFLERTRGLSLSMAALVATADLGGAALGSYFATRILARPRGLVACGIVLPITIVALVGVPSLPVQFAAAAIGGACAAVAWVAIQGTTLALRPGQAGTTSAVVSTIAMPAYAFPILAGAVADRAGLTVATSLYAGVTMLLMLLLVPVGRLRQGLTAAEPKSYSDLT